MQARSVSSEANAMCDQAYVNLLREKVRQLEAEERRVAAFGTTHAARFVPWIMPARSQPQAVSESRERDIPAE
jgi:hypothetical protein